MKLMLLGRLSPSRWCAHWTASLGLCIRPRLSSRNICLGDSLRVKLSSSGCPEMAQSQAWQDENKDVGAIARPGRNSDRDDAECWTRCEPFYGPQECSPLFQEPQATPAGARLPRPPRPPSLK